MSTSNSMASFHLLISISDDPSAQQRRRPQQLFVLKMGTDQDIYKHATGQALSTVEQHQRDQDIHFYCGWFVSRPLWTHAHFFFNVHIVSFFGMRAVSLCPAHVACARTQGHS